ncbi:hypothetical protein [uncultured Cohaesibacter sp.]|uniref:hypothetical protein n=1 Tax=uncultured Cohaesibacter sp. TaxID=1002546 RepID=UPI00292D7404|nr:hypothetical protein [uncultured Cohaesibacter sp.]
MSSSQKGAKPTSPSRIKVGMAMPAYGSNCHVETTKSLIMTTAVLLANKIHSSFMDVDTADIVLSRNFLISNFYYHQKECTHLLFIDNDMSFEPQLIIDMLKLKKDIVGILYPKRSISLEKFYILATEGYEFAKAKAHSMDFLGRLDPEQKQEGKFISVDACGTGIMLISRDAITRMIEKCPYIVDRHHFKKIPAFADLFTEFLTPFNKVITEDLELSEDYSFCHRWREECGGDIWASYDHPVSHYGNFVYSGKIMDQH